MNRNIRLLLIVGAALCVVALCATFSSHAKRAAQSVPQAQATAHAALLPVQTGASVPERRQAVETARAELERARAAEAANPDSKKATRATTAAMLAYKTAVDALATELAAHAAELEREVNARQLTANSVAAERAALNKELDELARSPADNVSDVQVQRTTTAAPVARGPLAAFNN
ncbi:MAG TPA: hypothetical protein VE775_03715, partial [Pyrinomonadaceae bacterium]|nr:hypothetical protein [Pyrinomonadaceae bacterium]